MFREQRKAGYLVTRSRAAVFRNHLSYWPPLRRAGIFHKNRNWSFRENALYLPMEELMQAVEFETFVENGMIPIPVEYRDNLAEKVRVIVLKNENTNGKSAKRKNNFHCFDIDMTGFVFNRDEANER
jgi:hypothetical protein